MRPLLLIATTLALNAAAAEPYFAIQVVDRDGGAPLPGTRLETTHGIVLVTDVNGLAAFYEPGLMDAGVFFSVDRAGYLAAADGFGIRGARVTAVPGTTAVVRLDAAPDGGTASAISDRETQRIDAGVPAGYFRILVVDPETGRGVPLAMVRTSRGEEQVTDSAGEAAYDVFGIPAVETVDFVVESPGYDAGSFSARGLAPGGELQVTLPRQNVAERLYRVTGGGIYRDSVLLGRPSPIAAPVLNAGVLGQDSVLTAVYRGEVFWIWGDTTRASYPLGNFFSTGARSSLPDAGGLPPEVGVELRYFGDGQGFVKPMAPVPGPGPVWLGGLTPVPTADGGEALYAAYSKVLSLSTVSETGVMRFNDGTEQFERVVTFDGGSPMQPAGHALRRGDQVLFGNLIRIAASPEAFEDPSRYEAFTPFVDSQLQTIERDARNRAVYRWRAGIPPAPEDARLRIGPLYALDGPVKDVATGGDVVVHGSDVEWNELRGRFVRIFTQLYGTRSLLGEIFYDEADTPMGPWAYARQVLSHPAYTLYNPRHHPFFDQEGGRRIYFEGTYTQSFSGAPVPTPRYDYNQLMHRLDLEDPRLVLPVPVYETDGGFATKQGLRPGPDRLEAPFFALDRAVGEAVAVSRPSPCNPAQLRVGPHEGEAETLFYAWPDTSGLAESGLIGLYEYAGRGQAPFYSVDAHLAVAGYERSRAPIAFVWRNPVDLAWPVRDYLAPLYAEAGPDLCLDGTTHTFDATASVVPAGTTFRWVRRKGNEAELRDGPTAEFTFEPGVHTVWLNATLPDGGVLEDRAMVEVPPPSPCGCATGSAAPGGLGVLLWLAARARRSKRPSAR